MSENYVECLIKAKTSLPALLLKYFLAAVAAVFAVGMFIRIPFCFFGVLLAGAGAYFVNLYSDIEYEYLYIDKEISVDKIMAKSKRKRLATYTLDRMEIFAPIESHRLDSYKNRSVKIKDYSIGRKLQPDLRYAMYYEGGEKILFSPSEAMVKCMKNAAPRKVFSD